MVHFNLDNQKYIIEFLSDNRVKITHTGNGNKVITVQYFADTKVVDFMQYIKSLDFSKLKDKTLYTMEREKGYDYGKSGSNSSSGYTIRNYRYCDPVTVIPELLSI